MTGHPNSRPRVLFVLLLAAIFLSAPIRLSSAQRRTARPARPASSAQPAAEQPKFKAIWEPVNYNQDLKLLAAFFITPEEGWVSGASGTILHTSDGGKTWTAQLGGDPKSPGPDLIHLYFLDRRHGWAASWNQLFRTTDGENWQQVGNDVRGNNEVFTTPTRGYRGYGKIYQTLDGGATWQEVFSGAAQTVVQGLTQQITCDVVALHFSSPGVGYGVGSSSIGGGTVVKTEDGGATWNTIYFAKGPGDERTNVVFFLDETRGFALRNTGLFRTVDGGKSWQGVPATPAYNAPLRFADSQVGWALKTLPAVSTVRLTYTADGGGHWLSRDLSFPAAVNGFSLPRRDTAYVVGEHGMVYRYRIVPIDYQVANMVDAPMMPGLTTPLDGTVATLREEAKALQAKLEAAQSGAGGTAASASPANVDSASSQPARPDVTAQASQPAQPDVSAQPSQPAQAGVAPQTSTGPVAPTEPDAHAASSAGQAGAQALPATGQAQDAQASAAPASQDQAPGGFVQDVGNAPPSPTIQQCCGPEVQALQPAVGSFLQQVPAFSTGFRPLNMIIAGIRLATDLLNKAQGVRSAFLALKTAPNLQAASAALQSMMTNLDGASQTITSRFQNTQSISWPEAAAASAASAASAIVQQGGTTLTQPANTSQSAAPNDTKKQNSTADDVKNKLKKKFGVKFP